MTVHMFRCFIGRGGMDITDLETRINDWVASNGQWEDDTVPHELRERNTDMDGTGETYYMVDVRFLPYDSKDNILTKLEDKLKNKVEWYRVGYHECTHDGNDGACSWDIQPRESGDIPDYIPRMEP